MGDGVKRTAAAKDATNVNYNAALGGEAEDAQRETCAAGDALAKGLRAMRRGAK